jgi:TetR/AcrR family tetracycline transcriptional repressor
MGAEEGADSLTMRRLADALGVLPNTLYTYFPDKAAILDAILDDVIGDVGAPGLTADWRRALGSLMSRYRRLLLSQPGLIQLTISRPMMGPKAIRLREDALTLLRRGGLTPTNAISAYFALFAYTTGFVIFEAARPAGARDSQQRSAAGRLYETLPADEFPTTRALAKHLARRPGDAEFKRGLERLLDGFAAGVG